MKLYAKDMFFRGETEKEYDYCIHGKVIFNIGEVSLSDDSDWCVSASAYRFLETIFEDHKMGNEEFLIPCCGHSIYPSQDKESVTIIGCNNGIDFDVVHNDESVIIKTADNAEYKIPFNDYKNAVLSFAKQISNFYESNPPRKFNDDFHKDGYETFMRSYRSLYEKATKQEKL